LQYRFPLRPRSKALIPACFLFLQLPAIAQTLSQFPGRSGALLEPPIPADRLELANNDAEPIQDATQRAAAIDLLVKALRQSNRRKFIAGPRMALRSP
jgi:hypothetical protein